MQHELWMVKDPQGGILPVTGSATEAGAEIAAVHHLHFAPNKTVAEMAKVWQKMVDEGYEAVEVIILPKPKEEDDSADKS